MSHLCDHMQACLGCTSPLLRTVNTNLPLCSLDEICFSLFKSLQIFHLIQLLLFCLQRSESWCICNQQILFLAWRHLQGPATFGPKRIFVTAANTSICLSVSLTFKISLQKKKACLHHTCDILALLEIRGEKKKKTNPVCLFTDKLKIQELFYIPMQKAKILNIYLFLLKSFCCPKVPSIECLEYMWTKSWMGKT